MVALPSEKARFLGSMPSTLHQVLIDEIRAICRESANVTQDEVERLNKIRREQMLKEWKDDVVPALVEPTLLSTVWAARRRKNGL